MIFLNRPSPACVIVVTKCTNVFAALLNAPTIIRTTAAIAPNAFCIILLFLTNLTPEDMNLPIAPVIAKMELPNDPAAPVAGSMALTSPNAISFASPIIENNPLKVSLILFIVSLLALSFLVNASNLRVSAARALPLAGGNTSLKAFPIGFKRLPIYLRIFAKAFKRAVLPPASFHSLSMKFLALAIMSMNLETSRFIPVQSCVASLILPNNISKVVAQPD